ncbi:hypothetical protein DPMN_043385 [Dreissena polymorpha]|uniref:Uncharacterized protein n=1 Tax=Dreissena polymorpha TaxID=45954 RepID=A0A9D4D295_DREPO|nr:hypothetical protein DPMN_043385 [Dreissena polymorpha]
MSDNSYSATVAEETLVHRHSEFTGSTSKKVAKDSKSTGSAKNKHKPSKCRNVKFDSIDAVDKQYRKIGFSKNTRTLLSAAWRKGTQTDYSSKFRMYNSWCNSRKINTYSSS